MTKKTLQEMWDFVQHMDSAGNQFQIENKNLRDENSNLREYIKKLEAANKRGNEMLLEQRGIIGFLEAKVEKLVEMVDNHD